MLLQCSSNKTCQNHARNCQGTKTIEMLGLEKIEILHPNMMKMEEKLVIDIPQARPDVVEDPCLEDGWLPQNPLPNVSGIIALVPEVLGLNKV